MTHYLKKLKVNKVICCQQGYVQCKQNSLLLGYTSKFLQEIQQNGSISDKCAELLPFCCALEKIFYFGLLQQQNKLGFFKNVEPWMWLEKCSSIQNSTISFNFKTAIDRASHNCTVFTDLGRFRLLIRLCLVSKCLHEPVQYLVGDALLLKQIF